VSGECALTLDLSVKVKWGGSLRERGAVTRSDRA
jgi:hypothetical protein